ncbi:MAG: DUF3575 domain-containing protein [Alistipes sp.]|jgi:hypothetical protein|nr:DUF3575 domain-containing protein [Alistipes sp.]
MKSINKLLLVALMGAFAIAATPATASSPEGPEGRVVTFKFVPGVDMFYTPWGGNDTQITRLWELIDEYREDIRSGRMPVYVDGYCASMKDEARNRKLVFIRSNRVKSEMIVKKGLVEGNFVTHNHLEALDGQKDVVVVTLRLPGDAASKPEAKPLSQPAAIVCETCGEGTCDGTCKEAVCDGSCDGSCGGTCEECMKATCAETETEVAVVEQIAKPVEVVEVVEAEKPFDMTPEKPYKFAVRTNLLYDAFLFPTIGVEWRATPSVGVKLDGSFAFWGGDHGMVQKAWILNPEVRWYMGNVKRFYLGAAANFGQYNLFGYPFDTMLAKNVGYQGDLWNAGVTVGYQLRLSRSFSIDFNVGVGYNKLDYDTFDILDDERTYEDQGVSEGFWGPTQAGVNLVWTIGGKK